MNRTLTQILPLALLLAALEPAALAGERLDALRAEIAATRSGLGESFPNDPKAQKAASKADALLSEADGLLALADAKSGKKAFKALGKAVVQLEKAAKKEGTAGFSDFVEGASTSLWGLASAVFVPDDVVVPGDPDREALENRLAKKLARPLKLAGKGKRGKAIGKLANAWSVLLELEADP